MTPIRPTLFLQWLGCLFALNSIVGVPFYMAMAGRWEKVFGVGGIIGYLVFQAVVFLVPFSLGLLVRNGVLKAASRLPKTLATLIVVCAAGLALSLVPRWILEGQAKGWRLLGVTTSCALSVGVLLGVWQAWQTHSGYRR